MLTELDLLAQRILTPQGYILFTSINNHLPHIWNRPTSSTGKYHKRKDGTVPTIAEHTFEMAEAASKIIRMFGGAQISTQNDAILLAILFHDGLKYGKTGKNPHTTRNHDQELANLFEKNRKIFLKHFSEDEFETFLLCIRFHSGIWSPDAKKEKLSLKDFPPEIIFVHMLDMLSTASYLNQG